MAILPEITDFGTDAFVDVFPDLEQFESSELDDIPFEEEPLQPYGIDLAFDFYKGDLSVSLGGDVIFANENRAFEQWVSVAIITPYGEDVILGHGFGSDILRIIHDYSDVGAEDYLIGEIQTNITQAILRHERVVEVADFVITHNNRIGAYEIAFTVIRDDSMNFRFEGINIA